MNGMLSEVMQVEIRRMVNRSGEMADYYAALDRQHFGANPSASNFVDFSNIEEVLTAAFEQRGGLRGNDRDAIIALGVEPYALLGEDRCRYLKFSARGRLGVTELVGLDGDVEVELVQEKPGIPLSLVVSSTQPREFKIERPEVDVATVIIGASGALWTIHPGLPVVPRSEPVFEQAGFIEGDTLSVESLRDARSEGGMALRKVFTEKKVEFREIQLVKVPANWG